MKFRREIGLKGKDHWEDLGVGGKVMSELN